MLVDYKAAQFIQVILADYTLWVSLGAQSSQYAVPSFTHMDTSTYCCCWCSVSQSCPTLCDPMDCCTPGFPVLHHLPELAQAHVHWADDAIHPTISSSVVSFSSCPQSFPASESFLIGWLVVSGGQSIETSAAVLPINIQSWFHSRLTGLISLLSKGCSRVLPNAMIWRHQFFSIQPSLLSNSHIHTCVCVCVC